MRLKFTSDYQFRFDNMHSIYISLQRTANDCSRNRRTWPEIESLRAITGPRTMRWPGWWSPLRRCTDSWLACGTSTTWCGTRTRYRTRAATGTGTYNARGGLRCTWADVHGRQWTWFTSGWSTTYRCPWPRGSVSFWTPVGTAFCSTPGSWTW